MNPLDLQEALNGAPVKLNNGRKAFVLYDLRKYPFLLKAAGRLPINGIMLGNNEDDGDHVTWDEFGKAENSYLSIIGMLEEPELTSEQALEKAYQEDLLVFSIDHGIRQARVVGKHKNGNYIICAEGIVNFVVANIKHDWMLCKPKPTGSNNVTLTLPRPFNPKQGDPFYYLTKIEGDFIRVKCAPSFRSDNPFDTGNSSRGNCFRTESDAKAWLDAMKIALDD